MMMKFVEQSGKKRCWLVPGNQVRHVELNEGKIFLNQGEIVVWVEPVDFASVATQVENALTLPLSSGEREGTANFVVKAGGANPIPRAMVALQQAGAILPPGQRFH